MAALLAPVVPATGAEDRAVTFIAFGDPQFGGGAEDKNRLHVRALNAVEGRLAWDAARFGEDTPVGNVRGVIIAGDLTQNGRDGRWLSDDEYGEFVRHYGLTGDALLRYPVYEGYGNHDFFVWRNLGYRLRRAHPVADAVSVRNADRPDLVNTAPGRVGHYSWEWGDIHLVMLNLCASDRAPDQAVTGALDPRRALTFLKDDLERHVAGTDKRVVIVTHYGFHAEWDFDGWWTRAEADAYLEAIRPYRVIGHIHGHNHGTGFYRYRGLAVFDVGSPYYTDYNEDGRGHFTVFRISADELWAMDVSWSPGAPEEDLRTGWHVRLPLGEER